jgi:zinc transport system substrate-binding protein
MSLPLARRAGLSLAVLAVSALPLLADHKKDEHADHDHAGHDHAGHDHAASGHDHHDAKAARIHAGDFEDAEVQPRPLSDWAGAWQSVLPYLADGTLDPVMEKKAAKGDKSAAEYRAYYQTGYATEVEAIDIENGRVTFSGPDGSYGGDYVSDGYEILTYDSGSRGVRYIFRKASGDAEAPGFIQFSDHRIAPEKVTHYHIYSGDDRAAVLAELTNWPTYYPASWTGADILEDQLAH